MITYFVIAPEDRLCGLVENTVFYTVTLVELMVTGIYLKNKIKQTKSSNPAILFFFPHQPYVVTSFTFSFLFDFPLIYFISWFIRNHLPVPSLKNSIFNIASVCSSEVERAWPWIQANMNPNLCSESHWLWPRTNFFTSRSFSLFSVKRWRKYPAFRIIARLKIKSIYEAQQILIINICEALSMLSLLVLCW